MSTYNFVGASAPSAPWFRRLWLLIYEPVKLFHLCLHHYKVLNALILTWSASYFEQKGKMGSNESIPMDKVKNIYKMLIMPMTIYDVKQ